MAAKMVDTRMKKNKIVGESIEWVVVPSQLLGSTDLIMDSELPRLSFVFLSEFWILQSLDPVITSAFLSHYDII
jgi:hypothetical protein